MNSDLGRHFEGAKRIGMRRTIIKWLDKEYCQLQSAKIVEADVTV